MTQDIRGRGAGFNPPNRFDSTSFEPMEIDVPCEDDEPRTLKTQYFRDRSKSVLAKNDSPDIGFTYSINPYRGCEHGCVYCLIPETPVLYADMSWRPIGSVQVGDVLVGFDEFPVGGSSRKYRASIVEAVWRSRRPTLRLVTENSDVLTTAEHRWLEARRWARAEQLRPGRSLRRIPVTPCEQIDDDYRIGYLGGMSLGDGTFRYRRGQRSDKLGFPQAYWRVDRNFRRGFLAGFFDAEGSNSDSLRISQKDIDRLERIRNYGLSFGFDFKLEPRIGTASTLRLVGPMVGRLRFFSICQPAIERKKHALFGCEMNTSDDRIRAIEPAGIRDVVDIQTSTRTFFAAGLATHNCYARPSHEWLGFSAGLDFESKIVVKEDAPELLRAELGKKSWVPQVVCLSGNTDCYQPVERALGITRRLLETFRDFRNPVGVITKNALVARDVDVLRELAALRCVRVTVSITTLDARLARIMEPRASTPAKRLEAIRILADAGVPVGVNAAPIIPGLTDEEIPAILEAARDAGARSAGTTIVRLPHAVKPLFLEWLERELPLRAPKVLARLREIRGEALTDARFGTRQSGEGEVASMISQLFEKTCRRLGLETGMRWDFDASGFSRPGEKQGELFG
jgi:DNA repair photolyase